MYSKFIEANREEDSNERLKSLRQLVGSYCVLYLNTLWNIALRIFKFLHLLVDTMRFSWFFHIFYRLNDLRTHVTLTSLLLYFGAFLICTDS